IEEQVASIWAGSNGKMDDLPVEEVLRFEAEMLEHLRRNTTLLTTIRDSGRLEPDVRDQLGEAIDAFKKEFVAEGAPAGVGREEFDAIDAGDVNQEQIVKGRRA
ncbi:MAG TPA: F0F1 ATP synthase subunit alpha, partial [Microbacteriaceae bacterium]|nr:F0F1 ATP synthase subunit alpha [Microbacteriaceae bacterium]